MQWEMRTKNDVRYAFFLHGCRFPLFFFSKWEKNWKETSFLFFHSFHQEQREHVQFYI